MENLKEKLEEAHQAIKDANLPEDFQKIAFSKIMDDILGQKELKKKKIKSNKKDTHKNKTPKGINESSKKLREEIESMCSLSRSTYSIIYKLEFALDQALFLIKIAEKEKEIKGLTPGQISTILKDVFKIIKTQAAISMALMKATEYTDRKKINLGGTFAYKYEIMHKGEDYLKKRLEELKKEGTESDKDETQKS